MSTQPGEQDDRELTVAKDGQPAALAIVSDDGTTTVLRLHAEE